MEKILKEFKDLRVIMSFEKNAGRLHRPFENFLNGVMSRITSELSKEKSYDAINVNCSACSRRDCEGCHAKGIKDMETKNEPYVGKHNPNITAQFKV